MKDIAGKTAVVTGASGEAGLAFVHRFAAVGLNVALADIEGEPLSVAEAALNTKGAAERGSVGGKLTSALPMVIRMHTRRVFGLGFALSLCFILLTASGCRGDDSDVISDDGGGSAVQSPHVSGTTAPGSSTTAPAPSQSASVLKFKKGQNNYTLTVDGQRRQFIVHVPPGYNSSTPAPLVFVFHESAHNGGFVYEKWKWREKCDQEGCISVYPTALSYFVVPEDRNQTKWNDTSLSQIVPPGTALADDVKFVRTMVETLEATFSIDKKRIYATGGSNGGRFVSSRILVELPDIFAAAGISHLLGTDGLAPKNNEAIPAYVSYGNLDPILLKGSEALGASGKQLPMEAAEIMQHPLVGGQIANALTTLGLDTTYTVEYCAPKLDRCTATYTTALERSEGLHTTLTFARGGKPGVEFRFRMIKGMGHSYALAGNNPAHLEAASFFWDFFKEHPKP